MKFNFELPKDTVITNKEDLKRVMQEMLQEINELNPKEEIMTIKETAEYLKVSVPTVRAMIAKELIPYFRSGNVIRLNRLDVKEWIRNNQN